MKDNADGKGGPNGARTSMLLGVPGARGCRESITRVARVAQFRQTAPRLHHRGLAEQLPRACSS